LYVCSLFDVSADFDLSRSSLIIIMQHPPLGKLTFWAVGKLVGYDANVCNYTKIDTPYAEDCKYIWLRATAAFFGSATAPIFYQLARGFGASPRGSLLTSVLFIFDGLNSSEARWVLIDSQLVFWIAFCALVGQFWFARWNRACDALDLHEARLIVASDVFERSKRLLKDSQGGSSDAEIETATIRAVLSPSLDAEAEATLIIGASANAVGGGDATARRAVAAGNGTPMGPSSSHDGVEEPTFQRLFTYDSINPAAPTTAANSKAVALVNAQRNLPQRVQDAVFFKLQQDSRYMNLAQRAFWILAVGIACGNAVSVKFTGLATPAILGLESLFALFLIKRSYPFPDLFCILLTGTLVFYCYWFAHFSLLWNTGDGDVFMMTEFQRTLKGNPHYDPTAQRANYWWLTTWLVQDMIKANAGILEPHAWQSTWDEWILNLRGVLYYSVDSKHTYTKAIYLNGNPIVVWFLLGCVVIAALLMVLWQRYRHNPDHDLTKFKPFFAVMSWCLVLYALNLLPYLGVKRSCL
jgi:dolichyl-phosphate-mannose--protein O-mannosyl transferase